MGKKKKKDKGNFKNSQRKTHYIQKTKDMMIIDFLSETMKARRQEMAPLNY